MIDCICGHVTEQVIQCPEHFHIFKGGKRLASVGSIIRRSFPMDPSIPEAVLLNARDRGIEVDRLFADYVRGIRGPNGGAIVPAGTRQDARDLLKKLVTWWQKQAFKKVEVQVLLGDSDHGGVLDFRLDGVPVDLKAVSTVSVSHRLQVAGYAGMIGPDEGFVLHITERLNEPKILPLTKTDFDDWRILLDHWRMLQRRTNG